MGWIVRRSTAVALIASLLSASVGLAAASAGEETGFVDKVNEARTANGRALLQVHPVLADVARTHSNDMKSAGQLFHDPDLGSVITDWKVLAENVGVGPNVDSLFDAFMDSSPHRANILGPYSYIGIGVANDGGVIWVTMIFMEPDGDLFIDIDDSVFVDDIMWLTNSATRFACNAPDNDRFCPVADLERETMAEFVSKTLGLPPAQQDYFVDDEKSPYEDSINRVAAAGITYGCNPPANDRFCPNRTLNRGEMAAFFVRALGLTDAGDGDYFIDDDNSPFRHDIDKIATAGITFGCNPPANNMYCQERTLNRAEISAFLHRALG